MRALLLMPPLSLLFLTGCISSLPEHAAPGKKIAVIAHRGASAYAPENTLAAFEKAAVMEADWFELDCTLTKDEAVIVIHDNDLERTTGLKAPVASKTLEEVKALEAGAWFSSAFKGEPLPTLAESLDLAKGRIGVYIEIKNSANDDALIGQMIAACQQSGLKGAALRAELMKLVEASGSKNLRLTRKVIELVREKQMEKEIVIQSFSPTCCLVALAEAPELRTEFLGAEDEDHPERWDQFVQFGMLIDVAGFNVSEDSLTQERLAAFHAADKSVAVWTVDATRDMQKLARWGVDAIITNKPDTALSTLAKEGNR